MAFSALHGRCRSQEGVGFAGKQEQETGNFQSLSHFVTKDREFMVSWRALFLAGWNT
jgi:hypothetical protein